MLVFFRQSSLYILLGWHQTNIWPMQIWNSLLNTSCTQSSTVHCFSLVHCNLVYFCLGINDSLCLSFLYQNRILFSQFFYNLVTNIDSCFCPFVFYFFCCAFSSFKAYYFEYISNQISQRYKIMPLIQNLVYYNKADKLYSKHKSF